MTRGESDAVRLRLRKVTPSRDAPTRAYISDDAADVVEFGPGERVRIVDNAHDADLKIRVAGMSASDANRVARQYGVRVTPQGADE